ncbi:MAG TPA: hypothetical protein VFR38_15335 [Gaiellaceae bacterium]|nr:hypothetical protein [Gaiellaceae bacterium]
MLDGNWRAVEGGHDQAGRRTYASSRLESLYDAIRRRVVAGSRPA